MGVGEGGGRLLGLGCLFQLVWSREAPYSGEGAYWIVDSCLSEYLGKETSFCVH